MPVELAEAGEAFTHVELHRGEKEGPVVATRAPLEYRHQVRAQVQPALKLEAQPLQGGQRQQGAQSFGSLQDEEKLEAERLLRQFQARLNRALSRSMLRLCCILVGYLVLGTGCRVC